MNQKLKVIVTAIISFVMVTLGTLSFAATTFSDIEGHWAKNVVIEMAEKGVLNGFEDGTFKPNDSVTREQFAKILVETLKIAGNTTNIKFVDIEEDRWSKDYIYRASRYLTGYENNGKYFFRPTEASVREDVAVAVVQAEGLQTEKPDYTLLNQFSDSGEISEGIKKYVAIAVKNEIMRGKDGYFDPQGNLTRAEVSQLMYNVFQKIAIGELESFSIGDVNGDGKITEEDAVLLYNYTVFPEDYASEIPYAIRRNADKYLDLDQDGNVDVIDAIVLKAYVNKDIKELPHEHTYKNKVCTGCKHELTILYGDVNGDGEITEEDAVLLYNYTVFPEDYASEIPYAIRRNADKYLDLDQDGNVDVIDAIVLKAYVNKDIKELPHEHTYKNKVCTGCKHELTILYGDANRDGKVTSDDVSLISKYLKGEVANIDKNAADVNLNGKIDIADAFIIMNNIFGMADFSKLPHDCKKPYTTEIKQSDAKNHEIVYTCGCGLSLGQVTEAHELKNDKCTKCGYEKEIIYGDVNGDGEVTAKDRLSLTKYIQDSSEEIDKEAADLNLDGKIDVVDLIILTKHLAKWADFTKLPHDCKKPYKTEIKQCDSTKHNIVYTCGCGLSLAESDENHEFKNDKCVKCGYEKEILYGDVNGDGLLNMKDVGKLLSIVSKPIDEDQVNKEIADVFVDGKLDKMDWVVILKYVAVKLNVEYPHKCGSYVVKYEKIDSEKHKEIYECKCGQIKYEGEINHEFENDECVKCGYKKEIIMYGDVNGDGTVDFYDVAKLNAYLKNNSTKINEKVADVNADGKITEEDATILYAYTRNEITKLPHSHQKITDGKCTECGYQVVGNISKITPTPDAELPVQPKPTPEVM